MNQRVYWYRKIKNRFFVKLVLVMLAVFCVTACSTEPEAGKSVQSSADSSESEINSSAPSETFSDETVPVVQLSETFSDETAPVVQPSETSAQSIHSTLDGTYWTAVKRESFDRQSGISTSQLPTETWWADLFLNKDGTAQFREVMGECFNSHLDDGNWWVGADNTLLLTSRSGNEDNNMHGHIEDGYIVLEDFYRNRFYLEKADPPGPGGELCMADLEGRWRMNKVEAEGRQYDAGEKGMASTLFFDVDWSSAEDTSYPLIAEGYFADFLDTDEPEYRQSSGLQAELLDEPLFHGLPNELWSVRLYDRSAGLEFYLTLTDPDTLYLQERYGPDGHPASYTAIYERVDSFLPEPLEFTLYEEPPDRLIFCWSNPPENIWEPLEMLPVTELEPNGADRLLLVGCWNGTQIRFCSGKGIWDDNGRLSDWVMDEILHDMIVEINEPYLFSLTIPEDEPDLCLYIKESGEEFWHLLPITDRDGYSMEEGAFLIS